MGKHKCSDCTCWNRKPDGRWTCSKLGTGDYNQRLAKCSKLNQ